MTGPGAFKPKVKSPKADKVPKQGKAKTTWDPFIFNGKGPSEEEARSLDRTVKSDKEGDDTFDPQLRTFVPDMAAVGSSAGTIYFFRLVDRVLG